MGEYFGRNAEQRRAAPVDGGRAEDRRIASSHEGISIAGGWQDHSEPLFERRIFLSASTGIGNRRPEEIKPNKRSLYRLRYSFLERLEVELGKRL